MALLKDLFEEGVDMFHDSKGRGVIFAGPEDLVLSEVFQGPPKIISRREVADSIIITYTILDSHYTAILEQGFHQPTGINFTNAIFGFGDDEHNLDYSLQDNPYTAVRVLSGAIYIFQAELKKIETDAVTFGATLTHSKHKNRIKQLEELNKRINLYDKLARWFQKRNPNFVKYEKILQTLKGKVIILYSQDIAPEKMHSFEEYLKTMGK